ncbi:hypothetical protein PAXRUDRAFT_30756 [Paxillus rubicundulus Ve08.2h10]|uniref:Uncharacterized protein n=1 Tax=Paxillus rubicundulus Ve08.2h10 TaxID=930991 RepID=A0A0D0E930_9AGAM|nr:hypothetical protein PAXRUDRAFT_30756 [Paxillus rubicundulus Ve08.2h10]
MASVEQVHLNEPHTPNHNAIGAFNHVLPQIKHEIVRSRKEWDKHQPKMWSRAAGLSDEQLVGFSIEDHLVQVRSGVVSYGTVIFGKIRVPDVSDDVGDGYIHVRIHDPPNRGKEDVMFHSILTLEGEKDADGHPRLWRAIQPQDYPLEFFNE